MSHSVKPTGGFQPPDQRLIPSVFAPVQMDLAACIDAKGRRRIEELKIHTNRTGPTWNK